MLDALTGLGVLLAPPSNALTAFESGGSGASHDCAVTPDDTFESPIAPANNFVTLFTGQAIGPWTVTKNSTA
jgi:hypothetical protein